jgi:hypothetical protein
MSRFRERLTPSWWVYVATALIVPATLLVFLPISFATGVVLAVLFYAAVVVSLLATSPVIEVGDAGLRAGRAFLAAEFVGPASAHRDADAVAERGVRLDARAWLLLRGWISPVARIAVDDPADPVPYWVVSTRRPEELVSALAGIGRPAVGGSAGDDAGAGGADRD